MHVTRWLHIAVAFILLPLTDAALRDVAVVDRKSQGGRRGGCRDWWDDLSSGYKSGIRVLDATIDTLTSMQGRRPVPKAPNEQYMAWSRINFMFYVMTGSDVQEENGALTPAADQWLRSAREVKRRASTTEWGLICEGKWTSLIHPDDRDPRVDESRLPRGERAPRVSSIRAGDGRRLWPNGFVHAHPRIWPGLNWWKHDSSMYPACPRYAVAMSIKADQNNLGLPTLSLCPRSQENGGFDIHRTRRKLRETNEHRSIERVARFTTTLVHEWTHMFLDWDDAPDPVDPDSLAYGFPAARDLASRSPRLARKNPDNFALFGIAMYLDEHMWYTGQGHKLDLRAFGRRVMAEIRADEDAAAGGG